MPSLDASHRLAVYGTLAPGKANEHELAHLDGRWILGRVRGRLRNEGWGAELGSPGVVLGADGSDVDVHVLESADLAGEWGRLDAFEGAEYRRVLVTVDTDEGPLDAFIYELNE